MILSEYIRFLLYCLRSINFFVLKTVTSFRPWPVGRQISPTWCSATQMETSWRPGWQEDSHQGPPCPGCWKDSWGTHGTTRPRACVPYYNMEIFSGYLEVLKKWNSSWEYLERCRREDMITVRSWVRRRRPVCYLDSWWWWWEVGWRADLLAALCQDDDISWDEVKAHMGFLVLQ